MGRSDLGGAQLGHSSIKMTVDVHLAHSANRATVDRLDDSTTRNLHGAEHERHKRPFPEVQPPETAAVTR